MVHINIDGEEFEVFEKDEEELVLLCRTGKNEDGGDGIVVSLPLDEEWFMKYKGLNLTKESIIIYEIEGFIKKMI